MTADEVLESYVTDVAVLLPRKQRNDVAFELRALLAEGLRDRAEAAGRPADEAMAIDFLHGMGAPTEIAARYRPSLTIVEPGDGAGFVRAAVLGLAIIWGLGLVEHLSRPMASGWDVLGALGQWWGSTVIPSLWWPGTLVVGYGAAGWSRRRAPAANWQPRATDRIQGGRVAVAMGLVGIACGIVVLIDPRWLLDFFWAGHAAPAAYQALGYTEEFRRVRGPCLLALILLNIPLLLWVLASGRWSPTTRRLEQALGLVTGAAMAWAVIAGPIFLAENSDKLARTLMALIVAGILILHGIRQYRNVRPMANLHAHG